MFENKGSIKVGDWAKHQSKHSPFTRLCKNSCLEVLEIRGEGLNAEAKVKADHWLIALWVPLRVLRLYTKKEH